MSVPDFHSLSLDQLRAFDAAIGLAIRAHPDFPKTQRAKDHGMTRYSKSDLVAEIAGQTSFTHVQTNAIIDRFLAAIHSHTAAGDAVSIIGFGTFAPRTRAARIGRNPGTGAPVEIAASTTLGFKAAKPKKAGA